MHGPVKPVFPRTLRHSAANAKNRSSTVHCFCVYRPNYAESEIVIAYDINYCAEM